MGPFPSPGEITMQDDFVALFTYDRWANRKVLDACRKLTAEQYVAEPVPGWSSVRSTVYHIALVTEIHLRTLAGDPNDSIPTEAELATVDDAGPVAGACLSSLRGASADVDAGAAQHRRHAAPARPNRNAAAVGDAAPHCQSFDLSPRAGGGQAQAVRGRTAVDGFLLLGDRADSAREVRVGVRSRSALDAAMVFGTRGATRFFRRRGLIPQPGGRAVGGTVGRATSVARNAKTTSVMSARPKSRAVPTAVTPSQSDLATASN